MRKEPAIAGRISDNLLAKLQLFACDLRRLDGFLANIERTAPAAAMGRPFPKRLPAQLAPSPQSLQHMR